MIPPPQSDTQTALTPPAPKPHADTPRAILCRAPVLRRGAAEIIDRLVPLPVLVPVCPPWIVVVLAYDVLCDAGGASVGKRLMGLRVRDVRTNAPASWTQSLARNGTTLFLRLGYGSVVFAPLALLWDIAETGMALARPDGRRLGDLIARTHVAALESPKPAPKEAAR